MRNALPAGASHSLLLLVAVALLTIGMLGRVDHAGAAQPWFESVPAPTTGTAPADPRTTAADTAEQAQARAVQLARRDAARRERGRRFAAVIQIGAGVGDDLRAAAAEIRPPGATSKRSVRRTPKPVAHAGGPGDERTSVLALALVALSGLTAGIALLPLRRARRGRRGATLAFIERRQLELAGISTSCLVVALLVVAGLI